MDKLDLRVPKYETSTGTAKEIKEDLRRVQVGVNSVVDKVVSLDTHVRALYVALEEQRQKDLNFMVMINEEKAENAKLTNILDKLEKRIAELESVSHLPPAPILPKLSFWKRLTNWLNKVYKSIVKFIFGK